MAIPVVIGITGHRDLREEDLPRLRDLLEKELNALKAACPDSPFILLSSLAEGADTLAAEAALDLGFSLYVPLPFALPEYRKDFTGEALERFDRLLQRAARVFTVPGAEEPGSGLPGSTFSSPGPGASSARNKGYLRAGQYIADHCRILLALWDGSREEPGGCGTAETVYYRLSPAEPLSPREKDLIQIVTPRQKGPEPENAFSVRRFGAAPGKEGAIGRINELNQKLLIRDAKGLSETYAAADRLAETAQKHFFRTILFLAVLCALLVFSFLAYDELESDLFLPVYAFCLLAAWLVLRSARKRFFHRDFLRFRVLAESLRTENYLLRCGVRGVNVCDLYTWTQRYDLGWLREASGALLLSEAPGDGKETFDPGALSLWTEEQQSYHENAALKKRARARKNDLLCLVLAALSVLLFIAVFALEYRFPAFMEQAPALSEQLRTGLLMHDGDILVRGIFKIALGVISAVTLFLSSYYGRLSLSRQADDHEKMAELYRLAAGAEKKDEALCLSLAREEMIENGNWLSYMKENTPGIDL